MNTSMRQQIDMIKAEMIQGASFMRRQNALIPISGERRTLPLKDREIGVVFYRAEHAGSPLILGFHGGGFLFGGSAMDDGLWSAVARQLKVNVISVDYRMSPDFHYPAPIEDAYDSAIYLKEHAEEYGFDPEHISVMGSSAGANIAAAVCIMAKQRGGIRFDSQILVYPFLDASTDPIEKGYAPEEAGSMYVFNELYTTPEQAKESCCSPLFASDEELNGLPTAIICTAEGDVLRKEGQDYAGRLQTLGVKVYEDAPAAGMPHGYFEYGMGDGNGMTAGFLPEPIKKLLSDGSMQKAAQNTLDFICEHY